MPRQALKKVPAHHYHVVETITQLTEQLMAEASKKTPNRLMLKIMGNGLKQAAQDITRVRALVERIVGVVSENY